VRQVNTDPGEATFARILKLNRRRVLTRGAPSGRGKDFPMLAKQKIHDAQIPFVYLLERMIEGSCNDTTCQEPGIDMSRSGRGGTELKRSSNREIDRQSACDA
jgi:hypothetical protein